MDCWCSGCSQFYCKNPNSLGHACIPNYEYCRYIYVTIDDQKQTPLFFCIKCNHFNKTCQQVHCINHSSVIYNSDFIKPFSCVDGSFCALHKYSKSSICLNNPKVKNLKIYTYFFHTCKANGKDKCTKCNIIPTLDNIFCAQNYVTTEVNQYIQWFLAKESSKKIPIFNKGFFKYTANVSLQICI